MSGDVNPKTCAKFTADERRKIEATQPHNLLHNSAARRDNINGLSLPSGRETVSSCRVEELKAMVIARGGGVTGRDGKALRREELQKVVRAYLSMEAKNTRSTVYFNRNRDLNGIFADIDTSERQTVPQIVDHLLRYSEFEPSLRRFICRHQLVLACATTVGH